MGQVLLSLKSGIVLLEEIQVILEREPAERAG